MTPAHLWSTLPEGLKGRHGGVVRNACLSEASCVEDSDHAASFVVRNIRAAGPSFGYFFAPVREEMAIGHDKSPFAEKEGRRAARPI